MLDSFLEIQADASQAEEELTNVSTNTSNIPSLSANQLITGVALGAGIYHAVNNPVSSPLVTTGLAGVYNNLIASVAAGSLVTAAKLKAVELSARALGSVLSWGKSKLFADDTQKSPVVLPRKPSRALKKDFLTKPSSKGILKPQINKDIMRLEKKLKTKKKPLVNCATTFDFTSNLDIQPVFELPNLTLEDTNVEGITANTTEENRSNNQRSIPLYRLYTGGADSHINPNIVRNKRGRTNDCFTCDTSYKRHKSQ